MFILAILYLIVNNRFQKQWKPAVIAICCISIECYSINIIYIDYIVSIYQLAIFYMFL